MARQVRRVAATRMTAHRRTRMNEALDYRLQGYTYRQIAEAMRISVSTAHHYIRDALDAIPRDNAEAVLAMHLEQYSMIVQSFFPAALQGDGFSADRVMSAMRNIERLQGVDSPVMKDAAEGVVDQLTSLRQAAAQALGIETP